MTATHTSNVAPTVLLVGAEPLLVHCGEQLRSAGAHVVGVVTNDSGVLAWCQHAGIATFPHTAHLPLTLREVHFDVLLSVGNRRLLPDEVLRRATFAAINFHDGPLPRYAGLNAPNWAIMAGESEHGVTWHLMTTRADAGDIVSQKKFEVNINDSAHTLNARCFEAGINTFQEVLGGIMAGSLSRTPHVLDKSTFRRRSDLPLNAAFVTGAETTATLTALARALNFGPHANPIALPRLQLGPTPLVARSIRAATSTRAGKPGEVLEVDATGLVVQCIDGVVHIGELTDLSGTPYNQPAPFLLQLGDARVSAAAHVLSELAKHEELWAERLENRQLPRVARALVGDGRAASAASHGRIGLHAPVSAEATSLWEAHGNASDRHIWLTAAFAAFLVRRGNSPRVDGKAHFSLDMSTSDLRALAQASHAWASATVPLRINTASIGSMFDAWSCASAELQLAAKVQSYAADLPLRISAQARHRRDTSDGDRVAVALDSTPDRVVQREEHDLVLHISPDGTQLFWDASSARFSREELQQLASSFERFTMVGTLRWNDDLFALPLHGSGQSQSFEAAAAATRRPGPAAECVHDLIAAAAKANPDKTALIASDTVLTYAELEDRSNRLAHLLASRGVRRGSRVAIAMNRTSAAVIAAIAVWKNGAAYVPIDPDHPAERNRLVLNDSGVSQVLTHSAVSHLLPPVDIPTIAIDVVAPLLKAEDPAPVKCMATSGDVAYLMYTSGSTGSPKGVLVEHRNVLNLFTALDERLPLEADSTWLSVTSMSFDISVLELFWTLSRGITVVIHGAHPGVDSAASGGDVYGPENSSSEGNGGATRMDFSLFYFSADTGTGGAASYRLLLEGARFADDHAFAAVWTPERHFHEFGGLYPNPAVTAAAVAAITTKVEIRAGSVVLPLHHPIRVAEDWSVVDNISNGRVGISFASGWQPNDFVIRPEAYKNNKDLMLRDIQVVRQLWRGETVPFPGPLGTDVPVRTLPRPVQKELNAWLTTAGNPETYRTAGEMGLKVLTHLLGQSVEELQVKIDIYREAWRSAGHPGDGWVSLMLHTFVADDENHVRDTVRAPLREYLRSSVNLIRDYAATFPALKRTPNGEVPDFKSLTASETEALLDYSVERYYETSGLFGTPAQCMEFAERLATIGVNEIACLIDFGVETDAALHGLNALAQVRSAFRSESGSRAAQLPTVAESLTRYGVTHLQCTPSLARLLTTDPQAHSALGNLHALLVGGEAFPPSLAAELQRHTRGTIHNMYGPTETTVWSTSHQLQVGRAELPIGTPFANTQLYVVNEFTEVVPAGEEGELWIGGAGVTRGYHNRDELTATRFLPDTFSNVPGARLYRTGDRVCYNDNGELLFRGRSDSQVKVLGHRIELGEIESALGFHSDVVECAVTVAGDAASGQHLEAYVVLRSGSAGNAELREHLRARLPEAMLPTRFIRIRALPRNPNGKVDRRALVSITMRNTPPGGVATVTPRSRAASPASVLEEEIAAVWRDVLGTHDISPTDNFFDIGGQSLLAVRVHSRLQEKFGTALTITDLFRFSTVRTLAAHIAFLSGDAPAGMSGGASVVDEARQRGAARREALRGSRTRST